MIPAYTIKTDSTTTDGSVYIGFCNSQDADVDAEMWAITRVTTDGDDVTVEHAGGEATPKYAWADRATLTYK